MAAGWDGSSGLRGKSVLLAAWVFAACGSEGGAPRPWTPDTGVLLFTSNREAVSDLFISAGDSGVRITDRTAPYNNGQWSPDGSRIALQTRKEGTFDIAIMDADGSNFTMLTTDSAHDVLPVWSPDGKSIAFLSTRGLEPNDAAPFPSHIYLVPDTGGVPRRLTGVPLTSSFGPQAFTPDGRSILLSRVEDGHARMRLLDIASGEETPLERGEGGESGGSFSPDGTMLAFHSESDSGSVLMVSNTSGGDRRRIDTPLPFNYGPRWSPDGQWLVFTGSSDLRNWGIYAIASDGSGFRSLIDTRHDEREGRWKP